MKTLCMMAIASLTLAFPASAMDNALRNDRNEKGLFQGKEGEMNLVDHGGMLEILARYAWMESRYRL